MYQLELTEQQLNIIMQSLGKQPAEIVFDIIVEIKKQYEKQSKKDNTQETETE